MNAAEIYSMLSPEKQHLLSLALEETERSDQAPSSTKQTPRLKKD